MNGGYDDGYKSCPCFWGRTPGSLFGELLPHVGTFDGLRVLDAGCGEGKNAAFLAASGASVLAVDVSELAIRNAKAAWAGVTGIRWDVSAITDVDFGDDRFDLVVAYGLLHCLSDSAEVKLVVDRLKEVTRSGGYHIVCAFNDRRQDLAAHPGFRPLLLKHEVFLSMYSDWLLVQQTDRDLHETHPHNNIPHVHSMTRLIAQRP